MRNQLPYFIPTREYVMSLKVGDMAPDCFGKLAKVTSVYAQRDDINGKAFVCYYTAFGETSTISASLKEGELLRHCGLRHTSDEISQIEREMLGSEKSNME